MKRIGMLILLVSLGLNIGLGIHLWRTAREEGVRTDAARLEGREGGWRTWPARHDTAAWARLEENRMERMTRHLGLDPEQARALRMNQRETIRRLAERREAIHVLRSEVRDLLAAAVVDTTAVRTALGEIGRRQAELDSLVAETILSDLAVLAPEQRARYLRLLPFDRNRHAEPGHRRQGGHRRQ